MGFNISSHVLSEDTISRELKNGKLYSTRLLTKTNRVPKWGEAFISKNGSVKIIEESVVDPKKKVLTTYTRNLGFTKVMVNVNYCIKLILFLDNDIDIFS